VFAAFISSHEVQSQESFIVVAHCLNQLMTFSFSIIKLTSLAVCFALVVGVSTSRAQLMQPDEKPDPPPKNVALEYPIGKLEAMSLEQLNTELEQLMPDFRQSLKAMWAAKTQYQHASKNDSYTYGKTWRQNATTGQAIYQKVKELSLEIYLKAEQPTEEQFVLAFRMAWGSSEEGRTGIANRVLKKMLKLRPDEEQVWITAARVAVYTNDYEIAARLVQEKPKLIEDLSREDKLLYATLQGFGERWEKEKVIREAEAKSDDLPRVEFKTSKGSIVIELFENEAPETVHNFIHLVESGFYENAFFHQVIRNFRAQTGLYFRDRRPPTDYKIASEAEAGNARHIFRGTIATIPDGYTVGASEFSIYTAPNPFSSEAFAGEKYDETVFGRVISGMDVVDIMKVNARFREDSKAEQVNAKEPDDYVVSARVIRKRPNVDYHPQKISTSKK